MNPANHSADNHAPGHDIERIVREVMSRLAAGAEPRQVESDDSSASLRMEGQVISLAQLDGKLTGVAQLVVSPSAVITPAAHDYLRHYNVRVARGGGQPSPSCPSGTLLIATTETTFDPTGLVSLLASRGVEVDSLARGELPTVMATIVQEILQRKQFVCLLSDQPALSLCLANRTSGIRACTGHDETDIGRNAAAIGANLLIVQPHGRNLFQLAGMATALTGASRHECPAEYQELLG